MIRLVAACVLFARSSAFIACFAFFGTKKDLGWTYQQNLARTHAESALDVETRYCEGFGLMDNDERSKQISDFVSGGCQLIFLCSGAFEFIANTVFAPAYPNVKFFILGGRRYMPLENLGSSIIKVYQASYIAGIVAASEPNVTRLGYVGSTYMADSILCINAFYKGAKSVNPNITMALHHVGNWFMPREERIAALRLFNQQRVSIVNYDSDSITVPKIAAAEQKKSICMKSDGAALVGDSVLCSQIMVWTSIIAEAIAAAMDPDPSVWQTRKDENRFVGFEKGALSMGTYGAEVSEATRARARQVQHDFAKGIDPVFCNQQESDAYKVECPGGAKLPQNFEQGKLLPFDVFGCDLVSFPDRCLTSEERMDLTYLFVGIEDLGLLQVESECPRGTLLDPLSQATCVNCPSGRFQDETDQSSCKLCQRGRYMGTSGATRCDLCRKGKYASTKGRLSCLPCQPGSSSENGATACITCEAGKSQWKPGQSGCVLCEAGKFSAHVGAHNCSSCDGVILGSTSQRGSTLPSECLCPKGAFLFDGNRCATCSEGLDCLGGNGPPVQKAGFWGEMQDADRNLISMYKCRNAEQCPSGDVGSCASGRIGPACNNCRSFHYPVSAGKCIPCRGENTLVFIGFGVILLVCLVILAVCLRIDVAKQPFWVVTASLTGGQLIFALQALGAIQQMRIRLSEPLKSIMEFVALFSLDLEILQLPCVFYEDRPITQYVLKLVSYPIFAFTLAAVFIISHLLGQPIAASNLLNINGVILSVLFISITLVVFLPFQCRNNPNGLLTMSTNPGLVCFDSTEHTIMYILAIFGILVYPATIFTWLLWTTLQYASCSASSEGMRWLRNYRFMFARFKPEAYYFGIINLTRGGLVAMISILLVRAPAFQTMAMGVVLTVSFGLQCRYMPWRTGLANLSDVFICCFLVLTIIGIGTLLDITKKEASSVMTTLLTVVILGIVPCVIGGFSITAYRKCYPGEKFGIFLCHHKVGAGALARQMKMGLKDKCRSNVFLDSDQVEDFDLIFDTVSCSTKNLVILFSPEVLSHMWCAGEIVTAYVNKIPIIPLVLNDTPMPTEEEIEAIPKSWTNEQLATLLAYDITAEMVVEAYNHVVALPTLDMDRYSKLEVKLEQLSNLVDACKLPRKMILSRTSSSGSTDSVSSLTKMLRQASPEECPIAIAGLTSNAEALAASEIMLVLLRRHLQVQTTLLTDASQIDYQDHHSVFVVMLAGDVLRDPAFAEIVLKLLGGSNRTTPEVITITADASFQLPTREFYAEVESTSLGIPALSGHGHELCALYRSLLSVLALPFSPLGSEGLIDKQVTDVCRRLERLLKHPTQMDPYRSNRRNNSKLSEELEPELEKGVGHQVNKSSRFSKEMEPELEKSVSHQGTESANAAIIFDAPLAL